MQAGTLDRLSRELRSKEEERLGLAALLDKEREISSSKGRQLEEEGAALVKERSKRQKLEGEYQVGGEESGQGRGRGGVVKGWLGGESGQGGGGSGQGEGGGGGGKVGKGGGAGRVFRKVNKRGGRGKNLIRGEGGEGGEYLGN